MTHILFLKVADTLLILRVWVYQKWRADALKTVMVLTRGHTSEVLLELEGSCTLTLPTLIQNYCR